MNCPGSSLTDAVEDIVFRRFRFSRRRQCTSASRPFRMVASWFTSLVVSLQCSRISSLSACFWGEGDKWMLDRSCGDACWPPQSMPPTLNARAPKPCMGTRDGLFCAGGKAVALLAAIMVVRCTEGDEPAAGAAGAGAGAGAGAECAGGLCTLGPPCVWAAFNVGGAADMVCGTVVTGEGAPAGAAPAGMAAIAGAKAVVAPVTSAPPCPEGAAPAGVGSVVAALPLMDCGPPAPGTGGGCQLGVRPEANCQPCAPCCQAAAGVRCCAGLAHRSSATAPADSLRPGLSGLADAGAGPGKLATGCMAQGAGALAGDEPGACAPTSLGCSACC
mmetsp:Transcript_110931/g.313805  ORF Transcript_110931/g.313805 Transcript_110931/m.313805 type:complete len:331 (-) Transcript_110931:231-1223(-)